jgi:hypothetical protein
MATLVPVNFLVARLTTPKAPWPIRIKMSYSLSVVKFGQLSETGVKFLQLALLFPYELTLWIYPEIAACTFELLVFLTIFFPLGGRSKLVGPSL